VTGTLAYTWNLEPGTWNPTTMEPEKKKVLFLCTGNAARSQMAEALARLDHGDMLDPVSAGSRPAFGVHSLAVAVMAELGSDINGARSKSAAEFREEDFDVVVTVCDPAAADCPTWPNARRIEHWSIEDPSFEPDPGARYERFVETRDDLRKRIDALAESLAESGDAASGTDGGTGRRGDGGNRR
jgi:arsenate reductase